MCKVIAIGNQKGGVSKTTSTSNLGIGLARKGQRVLVIDSDAQGSLTASLGYTEPDELEVTLATVLGKIINDEEIQPGEGILHHEEGIDLMPANIELSGLEVSLVNVMTMVDFRTVYARDIFEMVHKTYSDSVGTFETYIPISVKAAETSAVGTSIFEHCGSGKVAMAYESLTKELLAYEGEV